MDETTHSFSRKVLDRAMTIEMNAVSLNENITEAADTWKYPEEPLPNNLIIPEKTHGWQVYGERRADGRCHHQLSDGSE